MLLDDTRREALAAWIAERAGVKDCAIREARPLSGGAIQENWLLAVELLDGPGSGHAEFVLRADAPSGVAVSHSRAEEFALLQAARAAGVTAPEPYWLADAEGPLGRPFYLMAKAEGVGLGAKVVKDTSLGGDRAALAERLGRELARIHSIRPPRDDLAFLGSPPEDPAAAFVASYRAHLDALGQPRPALEWALRWLERQAPQPPMQVTLVHNDFRTGNYLVDSQGLTAVLDWEFAGWGDPESDLGWFCAACWRFSRPELEAGGIAARTDFYRGYEAESGRKIDDARVRYWEVAAHLRWAVIAVQQGRRHWSGAERSLELALTGRIAAELELALLRMTAPEASEDASEIGDDLPGNQDRPTGAELLAEARRLLREAISPALQGNARFEAAMIGNAMGIAERELRAAATAEEAPALGDLAARLRSGDADGDGRVHAQLLADAERRTAIANPAALERASGAA
ncbi:phosphotransferase [Aquibaculum arenosum]|uniref:Phosphotransferase n=1 Tax=Aquibaculum arenosum TaxID=3032591 RepID=A0ABT5YI67_9PROT|nr:phosphotransferase [Fodinicurvata sp. CAU 1616]MDF2094637.1 phosphotransferase [Fodinicurvata sp. CAU 1616]